MDATFASPTTLGSKSRVTSLFHMPSFSVTGALTLLSFYRLDLPTAWAVYPAKEEGYADQYFYCVHSVFTISLRSIETNKMDKNGKYLRV